MSEFGPFEIALGPGPGYLELLNLGTPDELSAALARIEVAVASGSTQEWVDRLLDQPNWRPHLVAAAAHLIASPDRLDPTTLWLAIERGSWVIPQLLVTCAFVDPSTELRVIEVMDWMASPNPKLVGSIVGLSCLLPAIARRVDSWTNSPDIGELLDADRLWDCSGDIVQRWSDGIREAFARLGVDLVRAHA